MKNNNFCRNICWMLISICIIASSGIHKTPTLRGDAREYLLMSQAFIAHGSASLRNSDVEDIVALPGNRDISEGFPPDILSWMPPFYSAKSGGLYSYHFWLFSLIFSPFVLLARLIGFADTSGYLFGNIFFVCLVVFSLCRSKTYGLTLSVFGSILFLSIGGMYYIRWAHPEVFSASLMCIGLVLLRDGRNKFSAFLIALAAQQNPPIILILPLIFALDVIRIGCDNGKLSVLFGKLYLWLPIVLVSALSMLFYRIEFGVFNLIAFHGMADAKLISIHRFSSLFLDPNFGIFWAIPFAFIAGAGILIFKATINIEWKWVFIFISMAVICAVPSLSTPNWNSDMFVISRYGSWCAVPLIFVFLEIFKCVTRQGVKLFVGLFVIFSQIGLVCFNKVAFPSGSNYVEFHPFSNFFMRYMPHTYSPVPEVFIERGINNEAMDKGKIYYWINSGGVEKVLLNRLKLEYPLERICLSGTVWKYISSVESVEDDWVYLNISQGCSTKLKDGFHVAGPVITVAPGQKFDASGEIFADGWSVSEGSYRWSLGGQSMLRFKSSRMLKSVHIYGNAFGKQSVEIELNGKTCFSGDVSSSNLFAIDLSDAEVYEGGEYELVFYWQDARRASDTDERVIAFAVNQVYFE